MSELFKKTIRKLGKELSWSIVEDSDRVMSMLFDMGEGRVQRVMFFHHLVGEAELVAISSAVLKMDGMPDNKIGHDMAARLLRENDHYAFGNWAIDGEGEDAHLIATARWWLDDLDKEEFEASVLSVSGMADGLEKTLGVDNF